ncbi:MAG: nitrous oxide reductase accessory protein NosL [Bacteroidia bacterium]
MASCSMEPKEIDYGRDACSYCKMNIVDQQHAAEIVTKKGKVYVYDAIECMLNDDENSGAESVGLYLVMDYNNPNTFIDAKTSYYLISENVPSPMGAFLSALKSEGDAIKMQQEKGGKTYNWESIQKEF